jgi:hypothetical protein
LRGRFEGYATMTTDDDSAFIGVGGSEAHRRKRMLDRIYAAMEGKMLEIETRLARNREEDSAPASAADNERDVRTLNTLTRMIEKITALGTDRAARGDAETDPEAEAANAERLRNDIAERIARLRRSEEIQAGHGGAGS